MKVVWLPQARTDRTDAIAYIARDNPRAALDQLGEIEQQTDGLADHPEMGRIGRMRGTRELVVNRTPFIIIYRVRSRLDRVEILRLLHGAQHWPPV
ncbi:type II toxin-antitoxin system RelE/ParE family toxin [Martelella soudanensis]|uniref:type II toxin-antitoxin system RelE/ParE family toxin n=1 Tax=unclassified Martelella TaxID=2629616 RepID=UPI0015DF9E47|nr:MULTISPECIES: type II toxin-antitoxin system RelE/ParE family toxin [unclassified Martelella]